MSFTMPYSKLYTLTELSPNDVKFISDDIQTLDLSKCIYLWYLWHVRRCNIVCGNICVVYRNMYGLKIYIYELKNICVD